MKRHYLRTVEDVMALKNTDTKILIDDCDDYYKFVDGIFCRFDSDGDIHFNAGILINGKVCYILEEEHMQEATEKDLGCLCYCWDEENDKEELGILKDYDTSDEDKYHIDGLGYYKHCRRLSPSEVAELTGYKVEEK